MFTSFYLQYSIVEYAYYYSFKIKEFYAKAQEEAGPEVVVQMVQSIHKADVSVSLAQLLLVVFVFLFVVDPGLGILWIFGFAYVVYYYGVVLV